MLKQILLIVIISVFSFSAYSQQVNADTTMATYLKTHRYILLSDSTHLPQSIQSLYPVIMAFANGDRAYLKNCYIPAGGTLDEQYTLTITLMDIAGIRVLKKYDEDKAASAKVYSSPGEVRTMIVNTTLPLPKGNLSGRDGQLIISKLISKVDFKLTSSTL